MKSIQDLNSVKYILHAGRNTVKIFVEDVAQIRETYSQLRKLGLQPKTMVIDRASFLDYFRIKSESENP